MDKNIKIIRRRKNKLIKERRKKEKKKEKEREERNLDLVILFKRFIPKKVI